MKKNILIIGVGGHLNSVIDILQEAKKFKIIGYLDNDKSKIGKYFYNIKVLGSDKKLDEIKKSKTNNISLSVGLIKNFKERMKLIKKLKISSFEFPNFYSKDSLISKRIIIGKGNIIMKHVLINNNVKLGDFNIINNKALIEHDVTIGSNVHISTGAVVNGNVSIGNNVFIGSGSIITNNRVIKNNTFIKAGSVI